MQALMVTLTLPNSGGGHTGHQGIPGIAAGGQAGGLEQQRGQLGQLEHDACADLRLREHLPPATNPPSPRRPLAVPSTGTEGSCITTRF